MSDHVTTLTFDLLVYELNGVTNWQYLGMFLGLSMVDIKVIEQDYADTPRRRMEMLEKWMRKQVDPSWEMVVEALEKMSELRLAHQLRVKYCTQQVAQHKLERREQDSTGSNTVIPAPVPAVSYSASSSTTSPIRDISVGSSGSHPVATDDAGMNTTTTREQLHYDLNQECSDIHFAEISKSIVYWREIAPFLELTEAEEIVIRDSTHSVPSQKIAMLRRWKQKFGTKATYKRLCQAFDDCAKGDLVELVKQLAASSSSSESCLVDRVGVSSPPTAVTGSPHSQATPGSPVTSFVFSTTTVAVRTPPTHLLVKQASAATPPTVDQTAGHNHHKAAAAFCDLNQECSSQHLAKISRLIVDWCEIAPFLELTEAEETIIRDSTPNSIPAQKMAMLRKWKQKLGTKATYKRLCQAFEDCENFHLVELVKQLAASSSSSES